MMTISASTRSSTSGWFNPPPPSVVAGTICWSAAAGGLDSAIGQGLFCLSHCFLLAWLVLSHGYSPSVLRRTKRLFAVLFLAWIWSIWTTWLFIGVIPEEAYARMARNFGAMAVLLSGLILSRIPRHREEILDWIAIQLAAISVMAILSWAADPHTVAWAEGLEKHSRFQGFVGNVNVNATLAAVGATWSGWRTLKVWSTWRASPIRQRLLSVALVGAFLVNFFVVLLSATRVVNFALCTVLIVGLGVYLLRRRTDFRPSPRHFVIAAGIFAAIVASQWLGMLPERYASLGEGTSARLAIWAQCLAMVFERPLSGFGLASFSAVYGHFLPDPRTASLIWTVNSPHNVLLQILLTGGLVYLALLGTAAVLIARPIVAAMTRTSAMADDHVLCVMLAIILGSASIDIALDYPLSIGLFGLLTGLLLGQALYRRKTPVADPRPEPRDEEVLVRRRSSKHRQNGPY